MLRKVRKRNTRLNVAMNVFRVNNEVITALPWCFYSQF